MTVLFPYHQDGNNTENGLTTPANKREARRKWAWLMCRSALSLGIKNHELNFEKRTVLCSWYLAVIRMKILLKKQQDSKHRPKRSIAKSKTFGSPPPYKNLRERN
jgi:hypothetical protein